MDAAAMNEDERKRTRNRCLRAWYVGKIPFAKLIRTTLFTPLGDIERESFYLRTPAESFPVASPEDADTVVRHLVTSEPVIPHIENSDAFRVVFVCDVKVVPTNDHAEAV